jgi:hypothetical protein
MGGRGGGGCSGGEGGGELGSGGNISRSFRLYNEAPTGLRLGPCSEVGTGALPSSKAPASAMRVRSLQVARCQSSWSFNPKGMPQLLHLTVLTPRGQTNVESLDTVTPPGEETNATFDTTIPPAN